MALFMKAFQTAKKRLNTISSTYRYITTTNIHDAALKVETLRSTYVKPKIPLGRKDIQLITFDLRCLSINYSQLLTVYRNDGDFNEVEEKLKKGLRLVLEDYFPLAGKIVRDEDEIFRVKYDDDMDGAEFKIASAEGIDVGNMMEGNKVIKFKEFFPYNGVSNFEGLSRSLLAVQLTKLKDGFALGCADNHGVVDGTSEWHFLQAWAQKCGGSSHILVNPFHDRTKARNTRVKMSLPSESDGLVAPPICQRVFTFSCSTVNKIKSNFNESVTNNGKPFSTFQCVTAHVWSAVTRARQLMPEDVTTAVVVADARRRIDSPVPEGYFGNLITMANTTTSAGVLYTSPPEAHAAMIRKTIEMLDANTIDKGVREWERNAKPLTPAEYGSNPVCLGSSPRFKYYELDFGWGMPETVRRGVNNRFDGSVFLQQGKNGDGAIDVDINLEDEVMKRLEMDKEFMMEV